MSVGEGGSGVASHILILLNFMNIAKRRSFRLLLRRRRVMYCTDNTLWYLEGINVLLSALL